MVDGGGWGVIGYCVFIYGDGIEVCGWGVNWNFGVGGSGSWSVLYVCGVGWCCIGGYCCVGDVG